MTFEIGQLVSFAIAALKFEIRGGVASFEGRCGYNRRRGEHGNKSKQFFHNPPLCWTC
jgi:hypothetical protein